MKKEIKNFPASVHARLKRHAQDSGRPFEEVFFYYAIERFLYRLSKSQYCKSFVLKGGLAFFGWGINLRRPTRDIDFQAYVDNNITEIVRIVTEVCSIMVEEDGMVFDIESIEGQTIMVDTDYEGVRVKFNAYLGKSRLRLHVDFSFANVITPSEINIEYPTVLDMPEFHLRGYNRETTIAEKFQAMVFLGVINDRLKDFFKRVHSEEGRLVSFPEVIGVLNEFLMPPARAAAKGEKFTSQWRAGRGWELNG